MKILRLFLFLFPTLAFAAPGDNFRPCQTFTASVTTSSAATAISACGAQTLQVDCYNAGGVTAFIAGGGSTAAAVSPSGTPAANGYHLGAGMDKVFDLGGSTYLAAITASGSTTIYCTSGTGQ